MGERKMYNFPFVEDGQTYWRSRSCTTVGYVFCADKDGYLCVLANQRGPGAPTSVGKWNVPCGYLDFHETGNQGIARETYEETGVKLKPEQFNFDSVSFSDDGDENVNLRYWVKLAGTIDEYPLSNEANEEGETSDIRWIRICDVKNYEWAFGQKQTIFKMVNHVEYTVDENGVQNVMPYLVSLIETTSKKRKLTWFQKIFTDSISDNWDVNCYGRIPLAVCDTIDKCREYLSIHINKIIATKRKEGFELDCMEHEKFMKQLCVCNHCLSILFHKTDKKGNFTEISSLSFDFMPIKKYD